MIWECSECGALDRRAQCPIRCQTCGTAGVIFVRSELDGELDFESGSLLGSWYRAGYEQAGAHPAE